MPSHISLNLSNQLVPQPLTKLHVTAIEKVCWVLKRQIYNEWSSWPLIFFIEATARQRTVKQITLMATFNSIEYRQLRLRFYAAQKQYQKKNPKSTKPQWRDLAAAPLAASGNFDCGDCILWRQQHCHSHIYTDVYEYFNMSCQETAAVAATRMLRFGAQRQLQPFAYWRSRCEAAIKAMLRKKLEQCLQANKSTLNAILTCSALFWSFCSASVTAFVSFLFYVPFLVLTLPLCLHFYYLFAFSFAVSFLNKMIAFFGCNIYSTLVESWLRKNCR